MLLCQETFYQRLPWRVLSRFESQQRQSRQDQSITFNETSVTKGLRKIEKRSLDSHKLEVEVSQRCQLNTDLTSE